MEMLPGLALDQGSPSSRRRTLDSHNCGPHAFNKLNRGKYSKDQEYALFASMADPAEREKIKVLRQRQEAEGRRELQEMSGTTETTETETDEPNESTNL